MRRWMSVLKSNVRDPRETSERRARPEKSLMETVLNVPNRHEDKIEY